MSKDRDNHNMSLSMTGRSLRRVLAVMILLAAAGGFTSGEFGTDGSFLIIRPSGNIRSAAWMYPITRA